MTMMSNDVDDRINLSLDELILQRKKSNTNSPRGPKKGKTKKKTLTTKNAIPKTKKPTVMKTNKTNKSMLNKSNKSNKSMMLKKQSFPSKLKHSRNVTPVVNNPSLKKKTNPSSRSLLEIQAELEQKVTQLKRETTKLNQAKQVLEVTAEIEQMQVRSRAQMAKLKFQHAQALSAKELKLRQVKLDLMRHSSTGKDAMKMKHSGLALIQKTKNIKDRMGPKVKVGRKTQSKKSTLLKLSHRKQMIQRQVKLKTPAKHNTTTMNKSLNKKKKKNN